MDIKYLEKLANNIPCMVNQECKDDIRKSIVYLREQGAIVEVGSWLGACTAQIMLGLIDNNKNNNLYVHDYFKCIADTQIDKALAYGVKLKKGKEYFSNFSDIIDQFGKKYYPITGDILKSKWDKNKKISLYIDDASKKQKAFDHMIKTFFPAFIPGETIIFMLDYFYFESKPDKGYDCQYKYFEKNKDKFELIKRIPNSVNAMFLYKGGLSG